MTIYSEHCIEYLKAGFSVIPAKGKKPIVKEWQKYCSIQPHPQEVKTWCKTFPEANIDVCMGKASGIIALDFDETDPAIIAQIEHLLPESPCGKVGKKGWTRFFKYMGEPTQVLYKKVNGKKVGVILELLSSKKKTTIPPSIHPDTKEPYQWIGKTLLEIDVNELPIFPPMLFAHLESKLALSEATTYDKPLTQSGRNLALTAEAGRLIKNGTEINIAVSELIAFDKEEHQIPLFTDGKEFDFTDANVNAIVFYTNVLKSVNVKRLKEGQAPELPLSLSNIVNPFRTKLLDDNEKIYPLPEPTGTLKEIYDYILERSYIEQPVFALSAAMTLLGTLASRKFTFQGATPNLYILNIADSGSGKDSCQQCLKYLIHSINASTRYLGATTYPSEAAITINLDSQPARLDIIDECSSFLLGATKGGAAYQAGISDTLCELFSCANSYYLGKILAGNGGKRVGACSRPHINLLCSTTYKGVSEGLNLASLEKGLFARFLVFFGENNKRGKRVLKSSKPDEGLLEKLTYLHKFEHPDMLKNKKKGNLVPYQDSTVFKVPCTGKAHRLLDRYHRQFDDMRVASKSSSVHRPIIARLFQQMMKMVLISAISNTKAGGLPLVRVSDVEFGHQMIQYYFQSIKGFVADNLFESHRGAKLNKVLNIIKGAEDGLTNVELAQQMKSMNANERKEMIMDLKEAGRIYIEPYQEEGSSASVKFHYIK